MMLDARLSVIEKRLAGIQEIIAVSSGKGGVGKSSVAAGLALLLSKQGKRVGLLDLDFHGPSAHILLGAPETIPEEENGIVPPVVAGVHLMSVVYYAGKNPIPLRGEDVTNAIIELLAITQWGPLDTLVVDMPPGVGDPALDAMRYLPRAKYLVVSTPSRLSEQTVARLLALLEQCRVPILGIVQNLCRDRCDEASTELPEIRIAYDDSLEAGIGDPTELLETGFSRDLQQALVLLNSNRTMETVAAGL